VALTRIAGVFPVSKLGSSLCFQQPQRWKISAQITAVDRGEAVRLVQRVRCHEKVWNHVQSWPARLPIRSKYLPGCESRGLLDGGIENVEPGKFRIQHRDIGKASRQFCIDD
jgi:hypothetical protein